MLIGHYSAALAAKAVKPELPLWQLFIAAQLVDIAWVFLVFCNIELMQINPNLKSNPLDLYFMPFSHSLLANVLWAAASLFCLRLIFKQKYTHALLLAAVVGSHWFLDFIVHRPDLLLYGDIKVGLALWDFPLLALAVELLIFTGAALWLLKIQARSCHKNIKGFALFFCAMAAFQAASHMVPMPEAQFNVLLSALTIYLTLPALAYWLEIHRYKNAEGGLVAS